MAESTTKTTKAKKSKLFPNEPMVTINIPLTRHEKDDVWVAVNGKPMQIQRGVDVEVPNCIYEALKHQERMLRVAMAYEADAMGKATADQLN